MRVTEDKGFLTEMFPNIMKRTRLLIIDHDVTRYHSYDLLRYQLFRDTQIGDKEHFMSIKSGYQYLLKSGTELADRVRFAQNGIEEFNIYECFNKDLGVNTSEKYTAKLHEMFQDPSSRITETDVGSSRFDVIFNRPTIDGFLLRYKGDPHLPSCYERLTVYDAENILDLNTASAIIHQDRINAIMICNVELAIRLATKLYQEGYKNSITIIIARYAYNFVYNEKGLMIYPKFGEELGMLETSLKYEFGFFDPFSGLTYRARFIEENEVQPYVQE